MKVSLIAAVGQNGEIGVGNALPWKLPSDMDFFRERTMGCSVVMGRRTWESIPEKFRPLKGRTNFVVTRNESYEAKGAVIVSSISEALKYSVGDVYIIGGSSIYVEAFKSVIIEEMILSEVQSVFPEADAFFPKYGTNWKLREILTHQAADGRNSHSFIVCKYVNAVAEGLGVLPLKDPLDPLAEPDPGVRGAAPEGSVREDEAEAEKNSSGGGSGPMSVE